MQEIIKVIDRTVMKLPPIVEDYIGNVIHWHSQAGGLRVGVYPYSSVLWFEKDKTDMVASISRPPKKRLYLGNILTETDIVSAFMNWLDFLGCNEEKLVDQSAFHKRILDHVECRNIYLNGLGTEMTIIKMNRETNHLNLWNGRTTATLELTKTRFNSFNAKRLYKSDLKTIPDSELENYIDLWMYHVVNK